MAWIGLFSIPNHCRWVSAPKPTPYTPFNIMMFVYAKCQIGVKRFLLFIKIFICSIINFNSCHYDNTIKSLSYTKYSTGNVQIELLLFCNFYITVFLYLTATDLLIKDGYVTVCLHLFPFRLMTSPQCQQNRDSANFLYQLSMD